MVESHPGCHCYNRRPLLSKVQAVDGGFHIRRRLEAFNFLRENPDSRRMSAREFEGFHPFSAEQEQGQMQL